MKQKKNKLITYNQTIILEAARSLFQKGGIAQTTVEDIARAADCSKATIYVYFQNKDDIYYHIVLEYMGILRDGIERCLSESQNFEAAYVALCDTLVQFEQTYPLYFTCILGKISVEKEKFEELPVLESIYNLGEEINEIIRNFLEQAKATGEIQLHMDSIQACFVLWSSICGLISIASNKQAYLETCLQVDKAAFLNNGFSMIRRMLIRGED